MPPTLLCSFAHATCGCFLSAFLPCNAQLLQVLFRAAQDKMCKSSFAIAKAAMQQVSKTFRNLLIK